MRSIRLALARNRAVIREAVASATAQPVVSALAVVVVAVMCLAVFLTAGRTVGAEERVLASLDSAGTRSIVVRAEPGAGLGASTLERLANIEGIDSAIAFSTAQDSRNAGIQGGNEVPVRFVWGDLGQFSIDATPFIEGAAWASSSALAQYGMESPVGSAVTSDQLVYPIAGEAEVPDHLRFLEPLVLVPRSDESADPEIALLVVTAARPELVATLADVVQSVLGLSDPSKAKLSTSEDLATLRGLIGGELVTFGRSLVLALFAVSGLLVAAILYGLVMMRRKDFGRRRALGATRGLIITLLLIQIGVLSAVGAFAGAFAAFIALAVSGDPQPSPEYYIAICVMAMTASLVAAVAPAVVASRRDPLEELRVP